MLNGGGGSMVHGSNSVVELEQKQHPFELKTHSVIDGSLTEELGHLTDVL